MPTDRLAPPVLPGNPTQADLGNQTYYQVCMACHGDRGQGLTLEWRSAWDPADQNCWQFRCHAASHPPDGFVLPTSVPAVVGSQVTAAFPTALALHDFIRQAMPYQAPGSLSDETYWQLTAYLMRLNGHDPGTQPLNAQSATAIRLVAASSPGPGTGSAASWPWLLALAIALVGAGLAIRRRRKSGSDSGHLPPG